MFSVDNMRNLHFKDVREQWKDHSMFVMGKNRIMALALGKDEAEEYADKVTFSFRKVLTESQHVRKTSKNGQISSIQAKFHTKTAKVHAKTVNFRTKTAKIL